MRNDPSKKLQNLDPTCVERGRLMFLPKWLSNHPEPYRMVHNEGALISADAFPVTPAIQAAIDARLAAADAYRSKGATESIALHKSAPAGTEPVIVTINGRDWLNPDAYFETSGGYVRLSDVRRKIGGVRCPFHNDAHGSEFIGPNIHTGRPQFVCTKCRIAMQVAPPATNFVDEDEEIETDTAAFTALVESARANRPAHIQPAILGAGAVAVATQDPPDNVHYFNTSALPDIRELVPARGVLFIRSPKGTGKTKALGPLIQAARKAKQTVLLLTHRRALADNLSHRLNLANYQESEGGPLSDYSVVCVNSLPLRLEGRTAPYDIIIVDESEQVLRNLLASTLQRNLSDVFRAILLLLHDAKRVICLDADLTSNLTIDLLVRMREAVSSSRGYTNEAHESSDPDDYVGIINTYPIGKGRTIRSIPKPNQLLAEISRAADAGKKLFVACSAAYTATVVGEILRAQGKRVLVITSSTSEDPEVKAFLKDPNETLCPQDHRIPVNAGQGATLASATPTEATCHEASAKSARPYDAIVASPSLQTGFSIDVPYFDAIYGWFQSIDGITYQDYDQALSRVRHCDDVTVWIQGTKGPPRIDPQELFVQRAIHKEMKSRKTLPMEKRTLTEGERLWVKIEGLINYLTAEWSYQRDVQFKAMKRELGFTIAKIEHNKVDEAAGRLLWGSFKDVGPNYAETVFSAAILNDDEYLDVSRRNQKSNTDHLAMKRYRLAKAIPEDLTLELVKQAIDINLLETLAKARALILEDTETRAHFDLRDRAHHHIAFTRAGHRTFEHDLLVKHLSKAVNIDVESFYDQLARGEEVEISIALLDQVLSTFDQRSTDFRFFFGLRIDTIDKAIKKAKATAELAGTAWTPEVEAKAIEEARRRRQKRVWDGTFGRVGLPLSRTRIGPRGHQVPRYYIDPDGEKVKLVLQAIEGERNIHEGVTRAFAGIKPPPKHSTS